MSKSAGLFMVGRKYSYKCLIALWNVSKWARRIQSGYMRKMGVLEEFKSGSGKKFKQWKQEEPKIVASLWQ